MPSPVDNDNCNLLASPTQPDRPAGRLSPKRFLLETAGKRAGLLACGLMVMPGLAIAQRLPDAGQIRQELERKPLESPVLPPRPGAGLGTPLQAPAPADGGPLVVLERVEFSGNAMLKTEVLQAVVADYLNRPLRFSDIQRAAAAVAERYRQDGWVVRTALPPQDLQAGVLRILVTEGRFGQLQIEGDPAGGPTRVPVDRVRDMVGLHLRPGDPLRNEVIDQTIRMVSELHGVKAEGRLATGIVEGVSDLILQIGDQDLTSSSWSIDNQGSRSTGTTRLQASLNLASPLRLADQLAINAMGTEGNRFLRLGYQLPVGLRGTLVGWSGSVLIYRLTDPAVAALAAQGKSRSLGMDLVQPLARGPDASWTVSLGMEVKRFRNEAVGVTTSDFRVDNLQLATSGYRADTAWGGGVTLFNAGLSLGRVVLDGSPNEAADSQGARTAGEFVKLRWTLSRRQRLSDSLNLSLAWSAQHAARNLDSSEKFYLGGAGGVRAYPGSEGAGRAGSLINIELATVLIPGVEAAGFVDHGVVLGDRSVDQWKPSGPGRVALQGMGLSLSWNQILGTNGKLSWSRRIRDNPNPTATGMDQDGTRRINRMWVEVNGTI